MKKEIIISLILAMCCIIASIPASAAETASCPPHGEFIKLCGGFAGWDNVPHPYTKSDGTSGNCPAKEILFYTAVYCGKCYDEMNNSMATSHVHGEEGHVCDETRNNNYCPITY